MDTILMKSLLYDFYGGLLTDRQKECYEMYHFENLTLMEIGAELGISPQAVRDIIHRTTKNLNEYEDKLGHIAKHMKRRLMARELLDALDALGDNLGDAPINDIKNGIWQLVMDT